MIASLIRARSLLTSRSRHHSSASGLCVITREGEALLTAFETRSFLARLRGLHAFPQLAMNEALVIRPCRSVHTYGMRYAIDVVFLDCTGEIIKLDSMSPGRWCRSASAETVIELAAGAIDTYALNVGQKLLRENTTWM